MFRKSKKISSGNSNSNVSFSNPNWDEYEFNSLANDFNDGTENISPGYIELADVNNVNNANDATETTPMIPSQHDTSGPYDHLYAELPVQDDQAHTQSIYNPSLIIPSSYNSSTATNINSRNGVHDEDDDPPLWAKPSQPSVKTNTLVKNLREQLDHANIYNESTRQENVRLRGKVRDLHQTITHLQQQITTISTRSNTREQEAINKAYRLQQIVDGINSGATLVQYQDEIDKLISMYSEADALANERGEQIKDLEAILKSHSDSLASPTSNK